MYGSCGKMAKSVSPCAAPHPLCDWASRFPSPTRQGRHQTAHTSLRAGAALQKPPKKPLLLDRGNRERSQVEGAGQLRPFRATQGPRPELSTNGHGDISVFSACLSVLVPAG